MNIIDKLKNEKNDVDLRDPLIHHILMSRYGWIPIRDLVGEDIIIEIDEEGKKKIIKIHRDGTPIHTIWNLLAFIEKDANDIPKPSELRRFGR